MSVKALPKPNSSSRSGVRTELLIDHFPIMNQVLEGIEDNVLLVRADDNEAGTFKQYGGENNVAHLRESGVSEFVVRSAGNHLRGTLVAAAATGMKVIAIVPANAPPEKTDGALKLWQEQGGDPADLRLYKYGSCYDDTEQLRKQYFPHLPEAHAFNSEVTIEGQSHLVPELLEAVPDLNITVSPTGGGGLIAGLTRGFARYAPHVVSYAIEAPGCDSLSRTLRSGSRKVMGASNPNHLFGGLSVDYAGSTCVSSLRKIGFSHKQIASSSLGDILQLAESYQGEYNNALEPSSLVAVAGLINLINEANITKRDKVAVIATGHNESPGRLLAQTSKPRFRAASAHVLRHCQ